MAIKVCDVDLLEPLKPILGTEGYDGLYILVREGGRPVGWTCLTVQGPVVSSEVLRQAIGKYIGRGPQPAAPGESLDTAAQESAPLTPISVVVCAREGTDRLRLCLESLIALDYPEYEIIVVDSEQHSGETAQLAAHLPVRYVQEVRPGLSWARNAGIAEAHYDIVAFIDDSVRPDRGWLRVIGSAFEAAQVMAVTGLVAPAELETAEQIRFELSCRGVRREFRRRVVEGRDLTPTQLLQANRYGAGSNMAFRRELFDTSGPFDVALGTGTACGGGGVMEMFHRLLAGGYTLVYEPAALVWQTHPRDVAALRGFAYDKGRSFGAYLFTCARKRTVSRLAILRFAVWRWLGGRLLRRLWRPGRLPRHLVAIELAGALLSPLAYRAAQTRATYITATTSAATGTRPKRYAPDAQPSHTENLS